MSTRYEEKINMDKMKMESVNMTEQNIERIGELSGFSE